MRELFERYSQFGLRYNFDAGPDQIQSVDDARTHGLNCGALAHLLTFELFGRRLPWQLMCLELFHDTEYFDHPIPFIDLEVGDVLFFGKDGIQEPLKTFVPDPAVGGSFRNWVDHPMLHLGICTQNCGYYEDCQVIHATPMTNGVIIWPMRRFQLTKSYRILYGVRRLKQELRQQGP